MFRTAKDNNINNVAAEHCTETGMTLTDLPGILNGTFDSIAERLVGSGF